MTIAEPRTPMTEHRLQNGDREVAFVGRQLATATSRGGQNADALRWFVITIFVTEAGKYVIQKVGRTRVYHSVDGCESKEGRRINIEALLLDEAGIPDEQLDDLAPCPVCTPIPGDDLYLYPQADVVLETDRTAVLIADDATALVEAAKNRSREDEGVSYMTKVAAHALKLASAQDASVYDAFMVERIA